MGTGETEELQRAIKELCARVGWSQKQLARQLYWELYDVDNKKEERQFGERLKKELFRETTSPELLKYYLDIIRTLPAIEKANLIVPFYHSAKTLDPELERAFIALSAKASRKLLEPKG